jgi:hypothetical protein
MNEIWNQSNGAARKAMVLGGLAQASFFCPIVLIFLMRVWDRVGVFFLLFWPLSLFLAVRATSQSTLASRQGQWWRLDGGKRFLCVLFGLPVLLLALAAGLLMRR